MPTSPRNLTGRTGRYKCAAQLSNPRDDEGIVPYAKGKNVPCNQVRPNISGVPYTSAAGGPLSPRGRVGDTPAGGRLPPRGRWQGEALTDEGKKPLPSNQPRFYSIGVPSTPAAAAAPSPGRRGQGHRKPSPGRGWHAEGVTGVGRDAEPTRYRPSSAACGRHLPPGEGKETPPPEVAFPQGKVRFS